LRFLLSDDKSEVTAVGDFESVIITVSGIGFHQGGESGNWTEPDDFVPWTGDLLDLIGTNATVLWSGYIEPGNYTKAFIYVSNVTGTLTPEAGGGQVNVRIPSGKFQITVPFTVTEGGAIVDFVFDITIMKAGKSGKYLIKPQVGESGPHREFVIHGKGKDKREIEFKGTIQSLDPLVVGNYTVVIDNKTDIEGELMAGLTAKVEGVLQGDGSVLASEIEVEEVENEIEFEGTITSLDPLVVGNYTVVVDNKTDIEGELMSGLTAKVEGVLQGDGSVLASEIEVEEVEHEIEFEGTVISLDPLVVGNYTVVVNNKTDIEGELMSGLTAEVEGVLQQDGTVLASEIEVEEAEEEADD